jgi:isopenicillin N synthase-like dioxygenase
MNSAGYDPKKANLSEAFQMQLELDGSDLEVQKGTPLHGPNQWPSAMPELRPALLAYWKEMESVSDQLLRAFALALRMPEEGFHSYFRKPLSQLRLIHYPKQNELASNGKIGIGAHRDTSAFTVLLQDDAGGLELCLKSGEWVVAPPIPGCFVINIGDMMKHWSNGQFMSTLHRVINNSGRPRFSVPFFANGDYDAVVNVLPHLVPEGTEPLYAPLACGPYILDRFQSSWPTALQLTR